MEPTNSSTDTANHEDTAAILEQVNSLIKQVTVDEHGKYVYPENTPPHLKLLVAAEKKFRDTQAGFTTSRQTIKEMEAELEVLREQVTSVNALSGLSREELEELEDLKLTDPDAWFTKRSELEKSHRAAIESKMGEAKQKNFALAEQERRLSVLAEFNQMHGVSLTNEILTDDVPPRIQRKLAEGKITFEEFLSESKAYLEKGKTVANPAGDTTVDLSKLGGGSTPASKPKGELEIDYSKAVF